MSARDELRDAAELHGWAVVERQVAGRADERALTMTRAGERMQLWFTAPGVLQTATHYRDVPSAGDLLPIDRLRRDIGRDEDGMWRMPVWGAGPSTPDKRREALRRLCMPVDTRA